MAIGYLAVAWLIVQVVETLFPVFGFSNESVRMVVIVIAVGFPLVLALSWLYELTPEGLKPERDVDHSLESVARRTRIFDRAIIVVLVLAIGYFAVDKFVFDPARDARLQELAAEKGREDALSEMETGNRIAVMPFVNRSGKPDDEYLSDGFSDDLIHLLSLDDRFEVISSRSSFSFKGKGMSTSVIAGQLDADYVVDGTLRRSKDNIRITAQLIDTRTDTTLWTESYDPRPAELFAIQDQISREIADSLKIRLSLQESEMIRRPATEVSGAHDAYLRGRYLVAQRRADRLKPAIEQFELAVELDPDYALGYAELSLALQRNGCDDNLQIDCEAEAATHAEKAMQLDPNLAEAHHAMSYLYGRDEALAYLKRAIELNPSYADAYARIATIYVRTPFRIQDRINAVQQALKYDPLNRSANWDYVFVLLERGLRDEALEQIDKFEAFDPAGGKVLRGYVAALDGNNAEYVLSFLDATQDGKDSVVFGRSLSWDLNAQLVAVRLQDEVLRLTGDDPEFIAWFSNADQGANMAWKRYQADPDNVSVRLTANILAHAGRYEQARPLMEKMWQRRSVFARNDFYTAYYIEALVAMRRLAGDEEGANEVLRAANDAIRRFREAGMVTTHQIYYSTDYLEGITRYLEGNREEAFRLISNAADDGFDIPPPSPFQQERFSDPAFIEIVERQNARLARERRKVLEVTCAAGFEHPVWTPTPETCEKYLGQATQ